MKTHYNELIGWSLAIRYIEVRLYYKRVCSDFYNKTYFSDFYENIHLDSPSRLL